MILESGTTLRLVSMQKFRSVCCPSRDCVEKVPEGIKLWRATKKLSQYLLVVTPNEMVGLYCLDYPLPAAIFIWFVPATRDDSQRRFLAQLSVAILEQCCNHSKQCLYPFLLWENTED